MANYGCPTEFECLAARPGSIGMLDHVGRATGETLRANHLRPLDDGLILQSEAVLAASNLADWSPAATAARAALEARIAG